MFTTPCFIRKNSKELVDKLLTIGYYPLTTSDIYEQYEYLYVSENHSGIIDDYPFFSGGNIEFANRYWANRQDMIDCGINEDLFLAIAALRNDIDDHQLFKLPNGKVVKCECESRIDMWGDFEDDEEHPAKMSVEESVKYYNELIGPGKTEIG